MREEYRQRLAKEFRYAATKMEQSTEAAKKLYYFSVIFGETPRIFNWEWNRELALISMVTQQAYTQINSTLQNPVLAGVLPINWSVVLKQLTHIASELASYFEKTEDEANKEELFEILGRLAEISYVTVGNGSYLYDKGLIKI